MGQVSAVMSREIQSRYTGDALGYGWAYITPLAWIGLIYFIFALLGRTSPIDTDLISFITSGVLPYLAFRFQVNALLRVKSTYRHVVQLPELQYRIVYVAIAMLEFCNALAIYSVLLMGNFIITGAFEMNNAFQWFIGFALASFSGAAAGYAVSANMRRADAASRFMSVVLRPLFYITPIFYVAAELPNDLIWIILWNPLLHAIEFLREGAFYSYQSYAYNLWVPIIFIIGCVVAGLYGEQRFTEATGDAEAVMD